MSDLDTQLRAQFYLGKLSAYQTIKVMISHNAFESLDDLADNLEECIFSLENRIINCTNEVKGDG